MADIFIKIGGSSGESRDAMHFDEIEVPWLALEPDTAIAVYDLIAINIKTMMRYNNLVRLEDKINDATSGSFG